MLCSSHGRATTERSHDNRRTTGVRTGALGSPPSNSIHTPVLQSKDATISQLLGPDSKPARTVSPGPTTVCRSFFLAQQHAVCVLDELAEMRTFGKSTRPFDGHGEPIPGVTDLDRKRTIVFRLAGKSNHIDEHVMHANRPVVRIQRDRDSSCRL